MSIYGPKTDTYILPRELHYQDTRIRITMIWNLPTGNGWQLDGEAVKNVNFDWMQVSRLKRKKNVGT